MARDIIGLTFLNQLQSKEGFDRLGLLKEKPSVVAEGFQDAKITDSANTKSEYDDKSSLILSEMPNLCKQLLSKVSFNTGEIETKKRPESGNSGHIQTDSVHESDKMDNDIPILSHAPNSYKENGVSMSVDFSDEGFVKIPRSLFNDANWKGMREKYRRVFVVLLFHTAFTKQSFGIGANTITIEPGQFCTSIRNLVELCNDGIKYKDDKVDKNIVERAVSLFTKIGLVRQEVRHGKSILTITQLDLYEHFQKQTETANETRPRLDRDTNEERKEREELEETIDGPSALDSFLLDLEKEEQKKDLPVFKPQTPIPQISQEKQQHMKILWEFIEKNSMQEHKTKNRAPGIKEKDLSSWLVKYDGKEIMECLKMTIKAKPNKTWPGYVTKLLRDRIIKKEADAVTGRQMVEQIVKREKMTHIDLKQDYFVDLINKDQMYYYLNPEVLKGFLKRSFDRSKEHEAEERRQKEYEDDY